MILSQDDMTGSWYLTKQRICTNVPCWIQSLTVLPHCIRKQGVAESFAQQKGADQS